MNLRSCSSRMFSVTFTSTIVIAMTTANFHHARGEEIGVWIGTETRPGGSQGIYYTRLERESGKLTEPTLAIQVNDPGFLARHPKLAMLYSTATIDGIPSVAAYAIERSGDTSALELAGTLPTDGGGATHVSTNHAGNILLSAQYGGGTVASFSHNDDGSLARRVSLLHHKGGTGVVAGRQEAPHPHWIGVSPDDRYVFVPDLGLDQVVIYKLDGDSGELTAHGHADTPPGSGPRHMKFSRDGKFAYVLNELSLSVSVFAYDANAGTMALIETVQTVSAQSKSKERAASAAEIRIHPSDKFVYCSNRGHDTITVFARNQASGRLSEIECEPIRGSTPRNFNIDPTGRWLIAAGQLSDSLSVLEIDAESGELVFAGQMASVPRPICVLFDEE